MTGVTSKSINIIPYVYVQLPVNCTLLDGTVPFFFTLVPFAPSGTENVPFFEYTSILEFMAQIQITPSMKPTKCKISKDISCYIQFKLKCLTFFDHL